MGQWICIISMLKFMTRFSAQLLPFVCSCLTVRASVQCDMFVDVRNDAINKNLSVFSFRFVVVGDNNCCRSIFSWSHLRHQINSKHFGPSSMARHKAIEMRAHRMLHWDICVWSVAEAYRRSPWALTMNNEMPNRQRPDQTTITVAAFFLKRSHNHCSRVSAGRTEPHTHPCELTRT